MKPKFLVLFSIIASAKAEERLSWFTNDKEIRKSIFVPDNLSEGKEENRVLPLVFNNDRDKKIIELKCIMRGYNTSNNPSDYKDARWSYPGFDDRKVNVSAPPQNGTEEDVAYRIWTIAISITAADAGKKLVTCAFQQGDFPLSIDFKFLIFRKIPRRSLKEPVKECEKQGENRKLKNHDFMYDFGGSSALEETDLNKQIEDDIKMQISKNYRRDTKVGRCCKKEMFCVKIIKRKGNQQHKKQQNDANKESRQKNKRLELFNQQHQQQKNANESRQKPKRSELVSILQEMKTHWQGVGKLLIRAILISKAS